MSIAISEDHRALADVAAAVLTKREARAAARALLESAEEPLPELWDDIVEMGWLGLHLSEDYGGSGYGIEEVAVVVEQFGRFLAPGPFVPTVIASALVATVASDEVKAQLLPGLAGGESRAGIATSGDVAVADGAAPGSAGPCSAAGSPTCSCSPAGADVAVFEGGGGVAGEMPNLDPTLGPARDARRRARHRAAGCPTRPCRPGPRDPVGRGRRHRPRVHRAGRRVRQGADAVRPGHRDVPGGEAPLRQHGRRHRAGDRLRRVGRRPRRVDRRRPAHLRRRGRRHPRRTGRRPVRQPQHPGARRHRLHLGARRPPLHAPGHGDRGDHRRRAGGRRPHVDLTRRASPGQGHRPARPRPSRSATRSRPSPRASRGCPPRTSARADRDRLRDAALAEALGPRRRRRRAARHRAGVRRRPASSGRPTASPAGSSSR